MSAILHKILASIDFDNKQAEFQHFPHHYKRDVWLEGYFKRHLQMPIKALFTTKGNTSRPVTTNQVKELILESLHCVIVFNNGKFIVTMVSEWLQIIPHPEVLKFPAVDNLTSEDCNFSHISATYPATTSISQINKTNTP